MFGGDFILVDFILIIRGNFTGPTSEAIRNNNGKYSM